LSVLLLAASWSQYVKKYANLEIMAIGTLPKNLFNIFKEFGAIVTLIASNINDSFSKTSNTIEGAIPCEKEKILLVDNDVVFVNSIDGLSKIEDTHIAGSIPCNFRVEENQWDIIRDELCLKTLPCSEIPIKEIYHSELSSSHKVRKLNHVYVNGGVIIIPANVNLKSAWERHVGKIGAFFNSHRLRSGSVYQSNMAGLATAIAAYGKFSWLPIEYNYRPLCFALGMKEADEIKIIHLTDDIKTTSFTSLSLRMEAYWSERIELKIDQFKTKLDKIEYERRRDIAENIKNKIGELIVNYELDNISNYLFSYVTLLKNACKKMFLIRK